MQSPLIEANDLLKICDNKEVIIIDASNEKDAQTHYLENHLLGALFIDLETDLSCKTNAPKNGGRHPLPTPKLFAKTLSSLGLTNKNHIVIYDRKSGANAAARLWWMLTSFGHQKVQVLNGGFQAAQKIGFPTESGIQKLNKSDYKPTTWRLKTVDINEVDRASKNEEYIIIDVRDSERFKGIYEPIDLEAGHIPNAINIPFIDNLDSRGHFETVDKLKLKYQPIFNDFDNDKIIFHCGSGVTACHSLLAIAYAGFEIPNLYVGSWSEWSRNEKPIETN